MKNIINKLYNDEGERLNRLMYYTDFFNTEPNLGTPILGYVISLEEKRANGEDNTDINTVKKSMMGVVSGLGDSLTQTILTPLFLLFCIYFSLSNNVSLTVILAAMLGIVIIYISYSGFLKGYYNGKSGLIDRINDVKSSKVKKFYKTLFVLLFGMIISRLILNYNSLLEYNLINIFFIAISSAIYQFLVSKKIKENYLIILVYLIPVLINFIN